MALSNLFKYTTIGLLANKFTEHVKHVDMNEPDFQFAVSLLEPYEPCEARSYLRKVRCGDVSLTRGMLGHRVLQSSTSALALSGLLMRRL